MEHIHTNKYGISIFYVKLDAGQGGECIITDDNDNYNELDVIYGHTKAVAIERARERRKLLCTTVTTTE